MVTLSQLSDNQGARKNRIRVGRGIGSGKGKTCGRGVKGQKARTGVAIKGFEGGQMPIFRRLPKRGFNNIHREHVQIINLTDIQVAVEHGRLNASAVIDIDALYNAGLIRNATDQVKLLGEGRLSSALKISVSKASASAIHSVNEAGATLELPLQV
jgi:large subunit ribosomal protein L15